MKVLTSPSSFGQISSEPFDLITNNGFKIVKNPYGRKLSEDEVIQIAKDCIGIVAGVEPLTAKVMDALPTLKCISRVGVGMDSVDLEYAKKKGIIVVNTPDGPTRSVAELAIGMTMALLRKIPQAHCALSNKQWKKQIGNLLYEKKIGVIGMGRIGKMVSNLFQGLGNEVIGFDLYPDNDWAVANNIQMMDIEKLLTDADIVTLHIPSSSKPIIAKRELEIMKKGAFLINISRGGVVNEDDLYIALTNGHLSGAAIDVFSKEPYVGPLCELENVVLTPHLGSYAREGKLKMEIDAVLNLIEALKHND